MISTASRPHALKALHPPRAAALTGGALVAFLAVGHTATDALTSLLTALLPSIQERFLLPQSTLAVLVATLSISASVLQPVFGALADRIDRRLIGALGIGLSAALLSLIGAAPSVPALFAVLLLGGLGSAAFHPVGAAFARAASGARPSLGVSLFGAGGTLGFAIGPVLALTLVATFGLGFTPWLMLPGVALAVLTWLLLPGRGDADVAPSIRPRLFDGRLLAGPIGLLVLSEMATGVAGMTFGGALPLWLVAERGLARDAALIGWTLSVFSLAAAAGGIATAALSTRVDPRRIVIATMLLAPFALVAILHLEPGSAAYFVAVALAGALLHGGLPLKIVAAQELAPHAVAAASGMMLGFSTGMAGLLYVGLGQLQEHVGIAPAMVLAFVMPVFGSLAACVGFLRSSSVLRAGARVRDHALEIAAAGGACGCGVGALPCQGCADGTCPVCAAMPAATAPAPEDSEHVPAPVR